MDPIVPKQISQKKSNRGIHMPPFDYDVELEMNDGEYSYDDVY